MCMNCGCGRPNDDKGNPANITADDLARASRANDQTLREAAQHIVESGHMNEGSWCHPILQDFEPRAERGAFFGFCLPGRLFQPVGDLSGPQGPNPGSQGHDEALQIMETVCYTGNNKLPGAQTVR